MVMSSSSTSKAAVALAVATSIAAVVFYVRNEEKDEGLEEVWEHSEREEVAMEVVLDQTKFLDGEQPRQAVASESEASKASEVGLVVAKVDGKIGHTTGNTAFLGDKEEVSASEKKAFRASEEGLRAVNVDNKTLLIVKADKGGLDKVKVAAQQDTAPVVAPEPSLSKPVFEEDDTKHLVSNEGEKMTKLDTSDVVLDKGEKLIAKELQNMTNQEGALPVHVPTSSASENDKSDENAKAVKDDILKKESNPEEVIEAAVHETKSVVKDNEEKTKSKNAGEAAILFVADQPLKHAREENYVLAKNDINVQPVEEHPETLASHSFDSSDETSPSTDNSSITSGNNSNNESGPNRAVVGKDYDTGKIQEKPERQAKAFRLLRKSLSSRRQSTGARKDMRSIASSSDLMKTERSSLFSRLYSKRVRKNKNKV